METNTVAELPAPQVGDTWYAFSAWREGRGSLDMHGEYVPSRGYGLRLKLERYTVSKLTPKGVWLGVKGDLDYIFGSPIWAPLRGRKRRAYPTIELARASFKRRKELAAMYARQRLNDAEALAKAVDGYDANSKYAMHVAHEPAFNFMEPG